MTGDGRPDPRRARTAARPAARRRARPVRDRLRRLAARASRRSSSPASSTPPSTRSAATPTRSATSCPTRSRCWTPSTSSSSAPRSSTKSAAASNRTPCGRRGHKDDPLYKIRGLLRRGARTPDRRQQIVRLNTGLDAGDPDWEVTVAWHCYQQLRSIYQAKQPAEGRRIAEQVIGTFPTCPIPEVARLGRTLRQWRPQVLAYFATSGVSNGGTEAINLLIEKTRRLAHGFRNFEQLPAPHPPRRRRNPALPPATEPCLIPEVPRMGRRSSFQSSDQPVAITVMNRWCA